LRMRRLTPCIDVCSMIHRVKCETAGSQPVSFVDVLRSARITETVVDWLTAQPKSAFG